MIGLSTMFTIYKEEKGFSLFKYMDTHCIIALLLISVMLNIWGENWVGILISYAFINALGIILNQKLEIPEIIES